MTGKLDYRYKNIVVILMVVQLTALYYLKYLNQNLPITEFSLSAKGNIFNLLVIASIILGLYFDKSSLIQKKTITAFIVISYALLCIAFILTKISPPFEELYILAQPGNKIFIAFGFTLYKLSVFSFLATLWLGIFKKAKPSFIKSVFFGIQMLIFFLILTFLYLEMSSYSSKSYTLSKDKKNIGVVLGAAVWSGNKISPSLSARVDKAIELYNNSYIGKILLTGSNAPGELTEAKVAYNYAIENGIDTTIFILEQHTTSSSEQIHFIKLNLVHNKDIKDIIVISDSYHLPRVLEISRFYNINVKLAASKLQLDFKSKLYNKIRESLALVVFWCFAL